MGGFLLGCPGLDSHRPACGRSGRTSKYMYPALFPSVCGNF
jgi:hypothetical protein